MNDLTRIVAAMDLAARLHTGQTRKGPRQEPYLNHVVEVAHMLAEATDGQDPVLIIGGLLHDGLEDGPESPEERAVLERQIESDFGAEALSLIREVTDPESANEAERWQNQIDSAPHKSDRGKLLKIADKTSNLREIVRDPLPHWDRAHRLAYCEWGRDVVAGCRGLNETLENWFDKIFEEAVQKYGTESC